MVIVLWQRYFVLFLKPGVGGSTSALGGAIGDMWTTFVKVQLEGISEVGCKPGLHLTAFLAPVSRFYGNLR